GPYLYMHGTTSNGNHVVGKERNVAQIINKIAGKYNLNRLLLMSCNPGAGLLQEALIPVVQAKTSVFVHEDIIKYVHAGRTLAFDRMSFPLASYFTYLSSTQDWTIKFPGQEAREYKGEFAQPANSPLSKEILFNSQKPLIRQSSSPFIARAGRDEAVDINTVVLGKVDVRGHNPAISLLASSIPRQAPPRVINRTLISSPRLTVSSISSPLDNVRRKIRNWVVLFVALAVFTGCAVRPVAPTKEPIKTSGVPGYALAITDEEKGFLARIDNGFTSNWLKNYKQRRLEHSLHDAREILPDNFEDKALPELIGHFSQILREARGAKEKEKYELAIAEFWSALLYVNLPYAEAVGVEHLKKFGVATCATYETIFNILCRAAGLDVRYVFAQSVFGFEITHVTTVLVTSLGKTIVIDTTSGLFNTEFEGVAVKLKVHGGWTVVSLNTYELSNMSSNKWQGLDYRSALYYNLGVYSAFSDDPHKAIAYYEKSIERDPYFSLSYSGLSASYLKLGLHSVTANNIRDAVIYLRKAVANVEKALELSPERIDVLISAMDVYNSISRVLIKEFINTHDLSLAQHIADYLAKTNEYQKRIAELEKNLQLAFRFSETSTVAKAVDARVIFAKVLINAYEFFEDVYKLTGDIGNKSKGEQCLKEAEELLEFSRQVFPYMREINDSLAFVYGITKEYDKLRKVQAVQDILNAPLEVIADKARQARQKGEWQEAIRYNQIVMTKLNAPEDIIKVHYELGFLYYKLAERLNSEKDAIISAEDRRSIRQRLIILYSSL
ncbi:MAG: hypothetical protein ABH858_03105, partial [Candidatus Omnitrophota bacterium]